MAELIGGASTQSRARRPLPPGAVSARSLTEKSQGVYEAVEFTYGNGRRETRTLLTWVVGQAGLLFGHGPFPPDIMRCLTGWEIQGSYGNTHEHLLTDALGEIYADYITTGSIGARYFQSGGEACAAAVRIARAATGRHAIASQGYHGAAIDFVHAPNLGGQHVMLPYNHRFEFGDFDGMRTAAKDAACLIVEVPGLDNEQTIELFLDACRQECDRQGIPFIVDDVVCGFRLALGGSLERYYQQADLVVLGKAISAVGGVSALVGRLDLMRMLNEEVFYSATFGGAPLPVGIAERTVRFLIGERAEVFGTDDQFGHLASIGLKLKQGFIERGIPCAGQPERSALAFESEADWLDFCSRMIGYGIMVHRPQFPTLKHGEREVDRTLDFAARVIEEMRA